MTDATPPPAEAGGPGPGDGGVGGAEDEVRKPRKVFLVVGIVIALVIGVFLFTSLGTSSGQGSAPKAGGPVPSFTAQNLGSVGGSQVSVSPGDSGQPTVLLFFGAWCPSCHTELPSLATAVRTQARAGGALSRIRVVGVDSEDTVANAKRFIHASGVTFPVAYDPNVNITSGLFYFTGDPYAVFVRADGTIAKIEPSTLSPSTFTADERALIPSGT